MAVDVTVPTDQWEDETEAVVTQWFASDGATVLEGALIGEIMVEKVQLEIRAPAGGVLKIVVPVDGICGKSDVIAQIN